MTLSRRFHGALHPPGPAAWGTLSSLAQISHVYCHHMALILDYHPDKRGGTAEAHEDFTKLGIAFEG